MPRGSDPREVVTAFLRRVRSGHEPDAASDYFAPVVAAHQLNSECEETLLRTPAGYAEHVREMRLAHGAFELEILHLAVEGDHVTVTWRQRGGAGAALTSPSGNPISELATATYRVSDGRIAEYWILVDRLGQQRQITDSTRPEAGALTQVPVRRSRKTRRTTCVQRGSR